MEILGHSTLPRPLWDYNGYVVVVYSSFGMTLFMAILVKSSNHRPPSFSRFMSPIYISKVIVSM